MAYDAGDRRTGEVYYLLPHEQWRVIRAVCQFDSEKGWTVIQRRMDGSVDFTRNYDNYTHGFGDLDGEYWIGNKMLFTSQIISSWLKERQLQFLLKMPALDRKSVV